MSTFDGKAAFFAKRPLIGMVHLGSLPGSARGCGCLADVLERATKDARTLASAGFDAVMVENFFDSPFTRTCVPPHTIAAMTLAVHAVQEAVDVPVGVNVLRNDVMAAIGIAHVCGARFVRCNVYVGAAVTDQGVIQGAARDALECRSTLGADVWILADVCVKHSWSLDQRPLCLHVADALERGLADAVIVTGDATGAEADIDQVRDAVDAAGGAPVLVGSGISVANVGRFLDVASGAIVGTSVKVDGVVSQPVDAVRARAMADAVRTSRGYGGKGRA